MMSTAPVTAATPPPPTPAPGPGCPGDFDRRFAAASEPLALFLRLRHGARAGEELDLVHEVYLRARPRAADFEGRGPGSFLAWLCAIARSVRVDEARRRSARPEAALARTTFAGMLAAAADPRTGPLTAAGREELRSRLAGAIAGLGDRERALLLDRFFGGRTQAELAEEHGMSPSAVQRALARALASVGGMLRELAPGDAR